MTNALHAAKGQPVCLCMPRVQCPVHAEPLSDQALAQAIADALPDFFAEEQPDWWYRDTARHLAQRVREAQA